MDVEKTSKDLVDECKVVSCEKERESGFCFQKYSKDEIFRIFHGLVYTPSSFEISEISKFRRKFRYFGVIFFGLHRGLISYNKHLIGSNESQDIFVFRLSSFVFLFK